jgi:ABC-2 type transport system ATP-binding protein/lipopolysaccharide transport system ATP-binding protein
LFDIAQGLLDELPGHDNIFTRGMLLGASRTEMARKLDEIIAFAELEDYIHLPVRTYSAGMKLRLAFAICTSVEADVVLMDEVIAIGDARFMSRANERLQTFVSRFGTIVLTSHSIEFVTSMCQRVVVLSHGRIVFDGASEEASAVYSELMK